MSVILGMILESSMFSGDVDAGSLRCGCHKKQQQTRIASINTRFNAREA